MQVSEVMHDRLIQIHDSDSIRTACAMMLDHNVGALPVFDEEESPTGFITDRDIVLACAKGATLDDEVSEAMSNAFITISKDEDVIEAAILMEEHQISRIMVVDGEKAVGIVSLHDLTRNVFDKNLKAEIIDEIKK